MPSSAISKPSDIGKSDAYACYHSLLSLARPRVVYTFDAGPNAFLLALMDDALLVLALPVVAQQQGDEEEKEDEGMGLG